MSGIIDLTQQFSDQNSLNHLNQKFDQNTKKICLFCKDYLKCHRQKIYQIKPIQQTLSQLTFLLIMQYGELILQITGVIEVRRCDSQSFSLNIRFYISEINSTPINLLLKVSQRQSAKIALNVNLIMQTYLCRLRFSIQSNQMQFVSSAINLSTSQIRKEHIHILLDKHMRKSAGWIYNICADFRYLFHLPSAKSSTNQKKIQFVAKLSSLYLQSKDSEDDKSTIIKNIKKTLLICSQEPPKYVFEAISKISSQNYSTTYKQKKSIWNKFGIGIKILASGPIKDPLIREAFYQGLKKSAPSGADNIDTQWIKFKIDYNYTIRKCRNGSKQDKQVEHEWSQTEYSLDVVAKKEVKRNVEEGRNKISSFQTQRCIIDFLSNVETKFFQTQYLQSDEIVEGSEKEFKIRSKLEKGDLHNQVCCKITQFTLQLLLNIFQQCIKGLSVLNENQVLHRDIKTTNILINAVKQIKIFDFGSAIPINQKYRRTHNIQTYINTQLRPTPDFFFPYRQLTEKHPEIAGLFTKSEYNEHPLFDIYSLGKTMEIIMECYSQRVRVQNNFIYESIMKLVKKCTEINPRERLKHGQLLFFINLLQKIEREERENAEKRKFDKI